jgi:hypothetical protein
MRRFLLCFCLLWLWPSILEGADLIPVSGQITLLKVFLQHIPADGDKLRIGIYCDNLLKARQISSELSGHNIARANGKQIPVEAEIITNPKDHSKFNCIYYSGTVPALFPDNIPVFSDMEKALDQGALVQFSLVGTSPEVKIGLQKLRHLKLSFPTSLMRFVTLVE